MFVKSLRLSGFKSFADPTILEFQPGVNVIVGPNGSGKSNIADALAWVLGAQAPSSLRGGSMEDVIFAGARGRARLGMADVELTLDNSSGVLPLAVSEVTVGRTTDRAGTSDYRINGAPCRLLDIAELLSDTGIGRSLHTVVGQGQLDQILQARPEDRRAFVEEAAQIGKYRRRKERAVRKIERVDDNLVRLNDVLAELRRAIRPLRRQASAAARHSELVAEHTELRQRLAATEMHRLARASEKLDLEGETRRGELLRDELASVRARLATSGTERERLGAGAHASQELAHHTARMADRLAGLGRLARERSARIGARLAAETEEGYRERIRLLEAELERWSGETETLEGHASQARARSQEAARDRDEARADLARVEAALHALRAAETDAAQALVRAEGSEAAGRATLGSIEARAEAVEQRRVATRYELSGDAAAIERCLAEVGALERELDAATEAAARAEAELEAARERTDELKELLGASRAGEAAALARASALEEVAALLSDLAEAGTRLAPLVEDARGRARTAHIDEEAKAAMVADSEAEIERRWAEVARLDEELGRLDALMSGAAERLAGSRRALERRETALAALDDELARARESQAAAELAAAEESAALPAKRAALEEAQRVRAEAERHLQATRARSESLAGVAADRALEARTAEERLLGARHRLEEAEAGIADAQAALEGLADLRANLSSARAHIETLAEAALLAGERAQGWAREAEQEAAEALARTRAADGQLSSLRARERELEQALAEAARRLTEVEVRRAEMRARAGALAERAMEEWGRSSEDLMTVDPLASEAEQETRDRVTSLERELRRLGPVNPAAAEEYAEAEQRERFLVGQIDDLQASRRDLSRLVRDVDATIVEVFGEAYEAVAAEFVGVFDRMFPGGSGRLVLTTPDDLLTTGIEIEARPPGKNVRKLSLLSGGERSLVALAFLFAIFRARPSPFYLLDEVEAALDDINLQRFIGLVTELEERAQVLVVTHQKRTMEAADVLYGVTMGKDGVSRVVAKRMAEILA